MTPDAKTLDAQAVLRKLEEIEREMRDLGFWDDALDVEEVRVRASAIVAEKRISPVGSMPFEHWLQAVFIPTARDAARTGNLPSSSQVSVMAMREYDWHSPLPEARGLLRSLREFDALFL